MAKTKCTKLTVDYRGGKLQFGIHPPTGQYRKKYKGHTLYLGAKPDGVLDQWLAKTDQLEIYLKASEAVESDSVTVKQLCDLFLSGKDRQVQTGKFRPVNCRQRHFEAICSMAS